MKPLARAMAPLALMAVLASGCSDDGVGEVPVKRDPSATDTPSSTATATKPPVDKVTGFEVQTVSNDLEHGWDIGFLPDGKVLVTERPARMTVLTSTKPGARSTRVDVDLSEVYVAGEGGLLGMVLHPDFETSRELTTCLDHQTDGVPDDIRLVTWRLSEDATSATRVKDLLTGLPVAEGGRHSGCRMTIGPDDALWVATGDTADGAVPQDLTSLGGKVLRLDLKTGRPMPDNPFSDAGNRNQRYVYNYGHRNLQGIAVRPGTDQVFTAEHGPDVNDEVNLAVKGANYGWDPAQGGTVAGYDESVPMTDLDRYPDAVPAIWESGDTTQAICSATFLEGEQWGNLEGRLVITALKGAKLILLKLDGDGAVTSVAIPKETNGPFGRLRASRIGPDGALYVTTTNGSDDKLLRITPRT